MINSLKNKHQPCITLSNSILLILVLIMTGCFGSTDIINSDRIHTDDVHQSYDLYYDANNSTADFYATFRVGGSTGTTVELVKPGRLEINNQEAISDHTYGVHYSSKLRSGIQNLFIINWTTNDGKQYLNQYQILSLNLTKSENISFSLSSSSLIEFEAPSLDQKNESLSMEIHQFRSDGTTHLITITKFDPKLKQFIINSEDLTQFQVGPVTLNLTRSTFHKLQQSTPIGGSTYIKYHKSYSAHINQ